MVRLDTETSSSPREALPLNSSLGYSYFTSEGLGRLTRGWERYRRRESRGVSHIQEADSVGAG